MQITHCMKISNEKLDCAAGATVFLTVTPVGAGPLEIKFHWRGSVPDTRANGRSPKNSKIPHKKSNIQSKSMKNGLKWKSLLPGTDGNLNGSPDRSQSLSEVRTKNGPLLLFGEVNSKK